MAIEAQTDEVDPIYRWNVGDLVIRGKYYSDQRVTKPTAPINNTLTVCQAYLRPGWEHVDTFLTHEDDLTFVCDSHQRELSYVFENPQRADLKSQNAVELDDLKGCFSKELAAIRDSDRWLISTLNPLVEGCLASVPFEVYNSSVRFNRFGHDPRDRGPLQMGVLIFEFDLIDAKTAQNRLQDRISAKKQELKILQAQLTRLKPISSRTGQL